MQFIVENKKNAIVEYIDGGDFDEPFEGEDMSEELEIQFEEAEDKADKVAETLQFIEERLNQLQQKKNKPVMKRE